MGVTLKVKRKTHKKLNTAALDGPSTVKVGFPKSKSAQSNIMKAIYNEFGTRGSGKGFGTPRGGGFGGPIPERPFLRNAMRNNRSKYQLALRTSAGKLLLGETSLKTVLTKLGALAQGDIQEEIDNLKSPPNSPVTIAIKGSSNPLIDTGAMRRAVTWIIER